MSEEGRAVLHRFERELEDALELGFLFGRGVASYHRVEVKVFAVLLHAATAELGLKYNQTKGDS